MRFTRLHAILTFVGLLFTMSAVSQIEQIQIMIQGVVGIAALAYGVRPLMK